LPVHPQLSRLGLPARMMHAGRVLQRSLLMLLTLLLLLLLLLRWLLLLLQHYIAGMPVHPLLSRLGLHA
jgi:hypothetical protein